MADNDLNEENTNPGSDPVEEPSTPDVGESFVTIAEASTSFSASLLQEVLNLISALGYTLTTGDDILLAYSAEYVEWEIKNACNVPEIPEGLYKVAVGLILSRFLSGKRSKLTAEEVDSLDFSPILKELSEGDTKQVWDTSSGLSASQRLDLLMAQLESGRNQFVTYRRLKW